MDKVRLFRRFWDGPNTLPEDELVIGQEEYVLSQKWAERFLLFMRRIGDKEGESAVLFIFEPKKDKEKEVWNLYWMYKAEVMRKMLAGLLKFLFFGGAVILLVFKLF